MAAGWTSPTEEFLTNNKNSNSNSDSLTIDEFSWMNSALFFGGVFACSCWTPITETFGRKKAGFLLGILQLIGWMGLVVSMNYFILLGCRFILGFSFIGGIIVGITYSNEVTSESLKGPLCSFTALFINVGFLAIYICGYLFTYKVLNIVCATIPVIYLILLWRIPESPIYLMMENQESKAQKSLMWYRGNKLHKVKRDMQMIKTSEDHQTKAKFTEVFASKELCKTIVVGTMIMLGQQFSGISVITAYTVSIFKSTGSSFSPYISAILMGILQVSGCALAGGIVNKVNQKYLLIASYVFSGFSFLLLSACFYLTEISYESTLLNWLPLIGALSYIFMFTIGIGPLPFVFFTWMFPPNVISLAMSIAQIIENFVAFIMIKIFPYTLEYFGRSGAFLILAGCNLFMGLYVLKYIENKKPTVLQSDDTCTTDIN